ncbi:MAG: hypothetical protein JOZ65_09555 [Chloroflexi bacterium]|nr:hypothetical protein [Chloroflexota bacterium]
MRVDVVVLQRMGSHNDRREPARPGPGPLLDTRSEYRIDDNWFVSGLKATGNNDLACAYALARQDLSFLIDRGRREEPLTELEIARSGANQAYVARLAVRATNRLFEVSGGHGLFETVAIRRFHRDVNAGSHQGALT